MIVYLILGVAFQRVYTPPLHVYVYTCSGGGYCIQTVYTGIIPLCSTLSRKISEIGMSNMKLTLLTLYTMSCNIRAQPAELPWYLSCRVSWVERQLIFLRKSDCLGCAVLLYLSTLPKKNELLRVGIEPTTNTLLVFLFLPSFISLTCMYIVELLLLN